VLHWNGTNWTHVTSPDPGTSNELTGVSVTSAKSAWAVGRSFNGSTDQTLVLGWNGRRWAKVTSPSPGSSDELLGVAATSAGNAWAVGDARPGNEDDTLILHWNGRAWTRLASPSPGVANSSDLAAVAAASASHAWAVGTFSSSGPGQALALHCC
jgi:hypothetical protein